MKVITISGDPVSEEKPKGIKVIWESQAGDVSPEDSPPPASVDEREDQSPPSGAVRRFEIKGGQGGLTDSLWQEINAIKQERETLSSSIAPTVARLQAEGTVIGTNILDPEAQTELSQLYDRIEALTREASEIYRRIEASERGEHGEVPPDQEGEAKSPLEGGGGTPGGVYQLKQLKRSIQNRRHKLRKKITEAEAKLKASPPSGGTKRGRGGRGLKLQQWKLQLASLDAEELSINDKLESL